MAALSGLAPAKVNLALRILDRRQDGFHELRTVFQTISLADRLVVSYQRGGAARVRLRCSDPLLEGPRNLAALAASELLRAGDWGGRVELHVEKRVPVGAGLGGGSSDAAAVLRALQQFLTPAPPASLVLQVAAELGSDVAFFLVGGTALGIGRGEEVYPLPDRAREWLLLLVPDVRISTEEAYRKLGRDSRPLTPAVRRNMINGFCSGVSVFADREAQSLVAASRGCFQNDFEEVVFRQYPELEDWKKRLQQAGASRAMMSGSGSALFGVFSDRKRTLRARAAFDVFPGKAYVVRTLSRRSYRRLWMP